MNRESTSVLFRPDLNAQVAEYMDKSSQGRFIAPKAAPLFKSPSRRGHYPIFRKDAFKKMADLKRGIDGSYNGIKGFFGDGSFVCDDNGLEYPIDDAKRREYASLFDAEAAASRILTHQILLGWEYRVAQLFANGGFTNTNVTTAWSTTASAVPLDDIQTGVNSLCDKWGCIPGDITLIIPRADFIELQRTTQVSNKSQYTFPGTIPSMLNPMQIAAMLGIKEVLVAASVYDSTEEGVAETNAMCWAAGVMFLTICAGENDPLEMPSAARTILWSDDSSELPTMESYRSDDRRSDIIRARASTDEILLLDDTNPMVYQLTNT